MAEKIVQTAGRAALGAFAPAFAHYNDDVLFGENWNDPDIDLKMRCIITVVALKGTPATYASFFVVATMVSLTLLRFNCRKRGRCTL